MRFIGFLVLLLAIVSLGCDVDGVEHGNVSIDLSPDGTTVAFSSADGDLFLFDLKSKQVTQLTKTDEIESVPAFSPDGNSIIYSASKTSSTHGNIFLLDLSTMQTVQLTKQTEQSDYLPRFSPDGKTVVFARAYRNRAYSMVGTIWDNWDVCQMDANGKNAKRLTNETYYQMNRLIPKKNNSIVYSAGMKATIYSISQNETIQNIFPRENTATNNDVNAWGSDIMISPDESQMVFASDRSKSFWYDVCVSTDGETVTGLIGQNSRYNRYPDFFPDGKRIVFMAGTKFGNGNRPIFSLWEVSINGKSRELASDQLFTNPNGYQPPNAE